MSETFTPPGPLNTAVLFLVFNRPDTTSKVFEAIRQAKPPRLYVAADGAREGREGEADRVAKVREVATAVDWPCEVKTLFRDQNLGCKYAVAGAITWFFEQEEQGIILEDDCLPSQSFFWFCEELLECYANDTRVGMIGGTRMASAAFEDDATYAFSRLIQIWGWASWRRAWNAYDLDVQDWPAFKSINGMKRQGIDLRLRNYLCTRFDQAHAKAIDTWDYQWSFACIKLGMLTAFPKKNLVQNIGFGESATHTKEPGPNLLNLEHERREEDLNHPQFLVPNIEYDLNKVDRAGTRGLLKLLFSFFRS